MRADSAKAAPWLETNAEVTECRYEFARAHTMSLGLPDDGRHFRITFTYYAHGRTYTDEFRSPTYMEQGRIFPITYNPLKPRQNSMSAMRSLRDNPLFGIGVASGMILLLLFLLWMYGGH